MADQQAIEQAAEGHQQQAELERLATLANAKNQEYQTRQSKHDLRTALDAVVSQDLQNDYLTQKAHELNPNMGEGKGTMTDETQETQDTGNIDALAAEVKRLSAGGLSPEYKAASKELAQALDAQHVADIASARGEQQQAQEVDTSAQEAELQADVEERMAAYNRRQANLSKGIARQIPTDRGDN